MSDETTTPPVTRERKPCPWCGRPAKPKAFGLMGFCSQACQREMFGEDDR